MRLKFFVILFFISLSVFSQKVENDSIGGDSIYISQKIETVQVLELEKNPMKAALYSAVLPGLGQIYNRKYWKAPIV